MAARLRFKNRHAGLKFFSSAVTGLMAAALVGGVAPGARAQQKESAGPARPVRIITVQGQVSLPEGMPAGRALVTLTTSSGVPRQAYTNELGRFEFPGMEEGDYTLSAKSVDDPYLVAERVEAGSGSTATSNLIVNLTLRREPAARKTKPPAVITTAEADQKVPKDARRAFREGVRLRRENEADKALESFSRAIAIYPDYFQALAERGDMRVLQGKLAEAAADFESALKVNPRYGPALRGAGYCKLERREFAGAVDALEKSVTAQPDNANTYLLLGIAYLELDRRGPAKMALFKALSFDSPHESRAYIYLGNLYAREGLYAEAADMLRKYLEANPTAPDAATIKAVEAGWRTRAAAP
jgi:Tfp pilus assembly protein PilF